MLDSALAGSSIFVSPGSRPREKIAEIAPSRPIVAWYDGCKNWNYGHFDPMIVSPLALCGREGIHMTYTTQQGVSNWEQSSQQTQQAQCGQPQKPDRPAPRRLPVQPRKAVEVAWTAKVWHEGAD